MRIFCFILMISSLFGTVSADNIQYEAVKDGINVRVDSTIQSETIGTLTKGEKVEVISENIDWYKIVLPKSFYAYVYPDYVKMIGRQTGRVKASVLNLRNKPTLESAIIGKIPKGTLLTVPSKDNGWYKVKVYPYAQGWVNKKLLKQTGVQVKEELSADDNAAAFNKLIGELANSDIKQKAGIYSEIINLGEKVVPLLRNELTSADTEKVYSLIYLLGYFGKNNPKLMADFFSDIDAKSIMLSAAYLDIIQDGLAGIDQKQPYYYLASNNNLSQEDIFKAKEKLQQLYSLTAKLVP